MAEIKDGRETSALLQVGSVLTVDATRGVAWVVQTVSGGEPGSPTVVTGTTQTFGPFDDLMSYRVLAYSGTITTTQAEASARFNRPFRRTTTTGQERGFTIPKGSALRLEASPGSTGALWERGTFSPVTPYVGSALNIGPFDAIKFYRLLVTAGSVTGETEWDTGGVVAPTLAALNVSAGAAVIGQAFTASITGKTSGSTITLSGAGAAGLTVEGASITGTPTTQGAVNLIETLAGATNSPRTTNSLISVSAIVVSAPTLSLSSAVTQAEGNSGTTAFVWTLTLNRDGSTASHPYTWAVTGITADAADFGGTFPSGSGTFAPGETSKTVTVLVMGDTAVEPDDTFTLTVTAAGLNTVTSTGTISNDDAAPAPSWTVQPSISGTPTVGQTLTGNDGTISNGTVLARAWLNGSTVLGTGTTYLLDADDLLADIAYRVTASGTGGSNTATSASVGPVAAAPVTPTAPPADWRMPATVATSSGLSGSQAALTTAQTSAASKSRPTPVVAAGATEWIEWTVAEAGQALVSFAGVSFGDFSFAVSLDGVDQSFAPSLPSGEDSNYRRQGMLLNVTAGQVIRLTTTASASTTIYPLLHKKPASGPWDGHLALGASREVEIHRSPLMEAEIVAQFPTRDPLVFNYSKGGQSLDTLSDMVPEATAAFGAMAKYAYVGSAAGNTISGGRPWTSGQSAAIAADYQAILDAFQSAGLIVTMASNRYGQYEGLPGDQSLGSLPYNSNILVPFLAANLPDAYNAALNTAQVDTYLLVLRHRDSLTDAVHGSAAHYALERTLIADSWYRRIYTGSWGHVSQPEQRIAVLEASQTSETNAKFNLDEAALMLAALSSTAAKSALQARYDTARPVALFYEAKRLIAIAETTRTVPDKATAQTALNAANTAGYSGGTSPNTLAGQQARIDAISIAAFDQIINIDLGGDVDVAGWNETNTTTATGVAIANLIDSTGAATGTSLTINNAPGGVAVNSGLVSAVDGIPSTALARTWWRGSGSTEVAISGLDPARQYDVILMASRSSTYTPTRFTVNGAVLTPDQESTGNVSNTNIASAINPTVGGQIVCNAARAILSSNCAFTVVVIKRHG